MIAYQERDPDVIQRHLIRKFFDWPTMSRAELADWCYRMKYQPREYRRALWVFLARNLPKNSMAVFKEQYYRLITDRRDRR